MKHFLDHLGPPMEGWWKTMGQPSLTPEVKDVLTRGITEEIGTRSYADLAGERDRRLVALLAVLHAILDDSAGDTDSTPPPEGPPPGDTAPEPGVGRYQPIPVTIEE